LKEADAGMQVADLCRKHRISDVTFYNWRSKFGGMDVSEARRLKSLEDENQKLKRLVAEQAQTESGQAIYSPWSRVGCTEVVN